MEKYRNVRIIFLFNSFLRIKLWLEFERQRDYHSMLLYCYYINRCKLLYLIEIYETCFEKN